MGERGSVEWDGKVGRCACEGYWCYGADMSGSIENIEAVVGAICAKVLTRNEKRDEPLAAKVDMYWHIVAAALAAGIIDETGVYVGELDWTRKMDVYCDWMRRRKAARPGKRHGATVRYPGSDSPSGPAARAAI